MIIQPMSETFAASAQIARVPNPAMSAPLEALLEGICPLAHLGTIRAQGADATVFLQGQLTQDMALLANGASTLAAYCSAKGRMLASFWVYKVDTDHYLLVCSRDILAATLKRLQMYVLRAKLKLSDASSEILLHGLVIKDPNYTINNITNCFYILLGNRHKFSINSFTYHCAILLSDAAGADAVGGNAALASQQGLPNLPPLSQTAWSWLDVMGAVATITQPVVEAFVPQMLNYESVGGVSFKKGCYPGQEVVARSQFRGTLKRRAYLVESATAMQVGQEVFSPLDAEQACGTVVQAAPRPPELELAQGQAGNAESAAGRWNAIVSMQVAAAEHGGLTLASATGAALTLLPLPYALLDDI